MLNLKSTATAIGIATGGALSLLAAPVQAMSVSFAPFEFSTQWEGAAPYGDVMLNSVTTSDRTITDFFTVEDANLISNDTYTGGNTGAASSDRGDAVTGYGTVSEAATSADVVSSLGNLNLNSIIDTEDSGSFVMDVMFGQSLNEFLFWERGMNSNLKVQAMGEGDNVLAEFLLSSLPGNGFTDAGFSLNTTEIEETQEVGAMGLRLLGASTNRLRLISDSSYNGPDFKVAAAAPVPEPMTIMGTLMAASAVVAARRKRQNA